MKIFKNVLGFCVLLLSSVSFADGYAGIQIGKVSLNDGGSKEDYSVVNLIGGTNLSSHVTIEGRLGKGIGSESENYFNIDVTSELDLSASVLLKVTLIDAVVSPYFIAGLSYVKMSAQTVYGSAEYSTTTPSYGIGAEVGESVRFNVEYLKMIDETAFDLDSVNVGIRVMF